MSRRFVAVLLIAAVFASACASGSDDTEVAATQNESTSDSSSSGDDAANATADDNPTGQADADADEDEADGAEVAQATDGESMAEGSPLGAFFSDDGGFEAAITEYRVRVEESIVVCMAAQGFEFARSENNTRNPVQDRQNDLTLREWTNEYGFGISTSFDSVTQNLASNPNFAIFTGLSEAERDVWAFTLNGVGVEALLGDGPVQNGIPLEEQGCIGQSIIETGGQGALEGLDGFGEIYEEGEAALFERREMVEVVDAWTQCMSGAGYTGYAALDDPEAYISEGFETITAPLAAANDELTDEEGQALLDGDTLSIESLPNLDLEGLRAIQAEEIALAIADLDCYEAEVQAVYEPLRDEFERGLLTEYSAEFDALRNIGS